MNKTMFRGRDGGISNSRIIADIVILMALIFVQEIIYFGHSNIVTTAIAAGTTFITIAGPAMTFLFWQKKSEIKEQQIEKKPCDETKEAA